MKLRLGAAVLLAAITSLTTVTTQPASAGVDPDPPAVGSCHDTTWREAFASSDADPAVACSRRHTATTFKVIELAEAPNWGDKDALNKIVSKQCDPAFIDVLGGNTNAVRRSAHTWFWFIPTRAQRDAGAKWLRCDLTLLGGDRLLRMPQNVDLGGLPLPDSRAKCRKGTNARYPITACSLAHQFRATHSIRYPHSSYPGPRVAKRFAVRECRERINTAFYYEYVGSRASWRLGYRHAICLKKTTR